MPTWPILLVLAVLAGAAALVALPLDLSFTCLKKDRFSTRVSVIWMLGLVRKTLISAPDTGGQHRPGGRKKSPKKVKARGKPGRLLPALRTEGFIRRVAVYLGRMTRAVRLENLAVAGRIGFDDPADTGSLAAAFHAIASCISLPGSASVSVVPDFHREVIEGSCEVRLRLYPILFLWLLLSFALSPVTVRAGAACLRSKRK